MRWSLLLVAAVVAAVPFVTAEGNGPERQFRDFSDLVPTPPGYVLRADPPAVLDPAKITDVQPTDKLQIIYHCWGYLGQPDAILDFKSFLRWGCQPSPHTCEGLNNVPRICGTTMFAIYDWVTPRHVNRLYRRCRRGAPRPVNTKTGRYVPYCDDFVKYLQKKYGGNRRHGGHGPEGGHHPPGSGHHPPSS